jgi:hypothetical protein
MQPLSIKSRTLILLLILPALIGYTACGFLLTGSTDPGKVQTIMDSTHARGCIYTRVSAQPWASATTVLVGTWGDPPPTMKECWTTLPPSAP